MYQKRLKMLCIWFCATKYSADKCCTDHAVKKVFKGSLVLEDLLERNWASCVNVNARRHCQCMGHIHEAYDLAKSLALLEAKAESMQDSLPIIG